MTPGDRLGDKTKYEIGVKVEKGWNLLVAATPDLISQDRIYGGGDIKKENIKMIYVFNPFIQQYARVFPNPEQEKIHKLVESFPQDSDLLANSAWVYSDKAGYLRFRPDEYLLDLEDRKLVLGWNFVGITPEFTGKKFKEMTGNCIIEKAYVYVYQDGTNPHWEKIVQEKDSLIPKEFEGMGMVVKVKGEPCSMGGMKTAENTVPSLPA